MSPAVPTRALLSLLLHRQVKVSISAPHVVQAVSWSSTQYARSLSCSARCASCHALVAVVAMQHRDRGQRLRSSSFLCCCHDDARELLQLSSRYPSFSSIAIDISGPSSHAPHNAPKRSCSARHCASCHAPPKNYASWHSPPNILQAVILLHTLCRLSYSILRASGHASHILEAVMLHTFCKLPCCPY